MPNYCDNIVTITHDDPTKIKRVVKAFNNGKLFQEFIPIPNELEDDRLHSYSGKDGANDKLRDDMHAKYGFSNSIDFCYANWGTKWEASGDFTIIDSNTVQLDFQTAWIPPIPFYKVLVDLGYKINAFYDETGVGFCGYFNNAANDHFDYADLTADTLRDIVGEDLDDAFGLTDRWMEDEADNEEDNEGDNE